MEVRSGQLYHQGMIRGFLFGLLFLSCPFAAAQGEFSSDLSSDKPAYVLKLPASVKAIFIAETATATLHRYVADEHGLLLGEAQRMSIGQQGDGKQRTGDQKTPLGIYFVMEELDTSKLHEKYGAAAFPLDYPNAWDALKQRTGSGIWIHGVTPGSGERPERDTDGCIALPNKELLLLKPYLTPLRTPVIVTRHIRSLSTQEIDVLRDQLLAALDLWSSSYRDGDWNRFLSLYSPDFAYRGMNREEWSAYRVQTIGVRSIDEFTLDEVLLLADPEEDGLYLSRFRQFINESGHPIETTKRLYWRRSPDGDLKIVAEDNG